uniref:Alpha-carbonic anhydrase domain-containing protein n=1 Tax=Kalanchoe fedtschenkoi TaxID=63787 RepID=A0A7N0R9H8_KALFE
MMKNFHYVSSCAVLLLLLISCLFDKRLQAQEVEDEREFDYIEGSEKGPENWGNLKKEWRACNEGDMQSPVDLTSTRVQVIPELGKLHRQYWASSAFIKNRGHDIAVCIN